MEDLIYALQIFLKYGNPENPSHCEHDYFYINIDPELVSNDDQIILAEFGFFIDEDFDGKGFGSYRYGSC
jgi:RimJ/RimL family protein N-acetyltransferase